MDEDGRLWTSLYVEDKEPYRIKAQEDKQRYDWELTTYKRRKLSEATDQTEPQDLEKENSWDKAVGTKGCGKSITSTVSSVQASESESYLAKSNYKFPASLFDPPITPQPAPKHSFKDSFSSLSEKPRTFLN